MRIQKHLVLSFAIALTIISAASAQGGNVPDMPSDVGVAITLQVAGQPRSGCRTAPLSLP